MRPTIIEKVILPLWEWRHSGTRLSQLWSLRASQWWSPEQLQRYQLTRLQGLYDHAVKSVPYYQRLVRTERLPRRIENLDQLRSMPLLSKADVRLLGDDLLSDRFDKRSLKTASTGGSTGMALSLHFDKCCEEWRNAAEMRSSEWGGKRIGEPFFALWGNPQTPSTLGDWFRDRILNGVAFLDTMAINDGSIAEFVSKWRRSKVRSIYGHAHSIYIVAARLKRSGVLDIRPRSIIATSMTLLDPEKRIIEEVFGCKVTNRYGCEEVGLIAAECERHDGLHVNSEHVIVELLRSDGTHVSAGGDGEVVVTDLNNLAMPLIRYRIEDMSSWLMGDCACGRTHARLAAVSGRVADFLKKSDGTLVAGVSLVERTLTAFPGIEQLQIVQQEIAKFELRVVPAVVFSADTSSSLVSEMKAVFGEHIDCNVVLASALERTGREKFRFSICRI